MFRFTRPSQPFLVPLILFVILGSSAAQKNGSLILRGTRTSFQNFTGIDPNIKDSLRLIELEYVNFHPDELVDALRGCTKLESLHLRRLTESQWKFTKRVTLPNLKIFTIDVSYFPEGPTEQQFKSMIFFDKEHEWKFEEIYNLTTDIKLSQYSTGDQFHSILFEINHSEGKFVTRLGAFIYKLLANLENNFEIKKFAVVDPTGLENIEFDPNIVQSTVRNLELRNVKLKGERMGDLFGDPDNVVQVSLIAVQAPFNIANLPKQSLRKLEIGSMQNVVILETRYYGYNNVQFPKLTTLKYYFTPIPNEIIRDYSYIFPSVKFVHFGLNHKKGSLRLLRNILGTCAQRIKLLDFNWGKHCDESEEEEDPQIIKFLKNANVPECHRWYIRLSRNESTGRWSYTQYSEEYDQSFNVGVDVPDTIQGEGGQFLCGPW